MLDTHGNILYIGKAKNLKNRVSSYFHSKDDLKIKKLVAQIHDIAITVTNSETEACLLESTLINTHKPKYNVIFRDDKSFPYILISNDKFPRLSYIRSKNKAKGQMYGPYSDLTSVKQSLNFLYKTFKLRQCNNAFFNNRSRPCLQYQIKRCSAPCVNKVDATVYGMDVINLKSFLEGKSIELTEKLVTNMNLAATAQNYELAAKLRDQIKALRELQKSQTVIDPNISTEIDIIGISELFNFIALHILQVRFGKINTYKQEVINCHNSLESKDELISRFLIQYYIKSMFNLPKIIYIPETIDPNLLQAINLKCNKNIEFKLAKRDKHKSWVELANKNAALALKSHTYKINNFQRSFQALQQRLQQEQLNLKVLNNIICFDVSHTKGSSTIASCVAYNTQGADKSNYKRFNIDNTIVTPSDDYAALRYALEKYFYNIDSKNFLKPDIIIIDGGKGQLQQAIIANFISMQYQDIVFVSIAKGLGRKPGLETIYFLDTISNKIKILPDLEPMVFNLLLQIRDAAHNFAITGHRQQRSKRLIKSKLDTIPGIGKLKRQALINHFGGIQEVLTASIEELALTPGISAKLAERIFNATHGS